MGGPKGILLIYALECLFVTPHKLYCTTNYKIKK